MAISLLLALLLGEAGLRLFWHNPYRRERPDLLLKVRTNHPKTDNTFDRSILDPAHPVVRYRTDARGYIRPSFQHERPDATIAFLGGSTTQCSAVRESQRFPALVSAFFNERGLAVNTLNAGYSGNTLHDSLNILLNHVLLDHPDIAVLMHAANDIGMLARAGDYRPRMARPVTLAQLGKWSFQMASSRLYLAGLARRIASGARIDVHDPAERDRRLAKYQDPEQAEIPAEAYRVRLRAFIHLCRDFNIEPVLMTQPMIGLTTELTPAWADLGAQDRFNRIIRDVGAQEHAIVIDLAGHCREAVPGWDASFEFLYDGMHATDAGSEIYARHITDRLAPPVEQIKQERTGPRGDRNAPGNPIAP